MQYNNLCADGYALNFNLMDSKMFTKDQLSNLPTEKDTDEYSKWYNTYAKPTGATACCLTTVNKYFERDPIFYQKDSPIRFTVYDRSKDKWASFITATAVMRMLKLGHTHLDIWQHAGMIDSKFDYKTKRMKNSVWGPTHYFSFDIDNIKEIDEIYLLLNHIANKNLPMPSVVSQTNYNNFHVVYYSSAKPWTWTDKIQFFCAFAGITNPPSDEKELYAKLAEAGIDMKYSINYRNSPEQEKFRIPGSINSKITSYSGGSFYVTSRVKENLDIGEWSIPEVKFEVVKKAKEVTKEFWEPFVTPIRKAINDNGYTKDKQVAKVIARVLAENITFLRRGEFGISQIRLAKTLDMTQQNVSVIIRKMLRDDFLQMSIPHHYDANNPENRTSRRYRLGNKLSLVLEDYYGKQAKKTEGKAKYDVTEPYVPGEAFDHVSSDIRHLALCGHSEEDIVDFLVTKDRESRDRCNSGYFRSFNDFRVMVRNWIPKMELSGRTPFKNPVFCLSKKLNEFREKIKGTTVSPDNVPDFDNIRNN